MRNRYWLIASILGILIFIGIAIVYNQNLLSSEDNGIDVPESVGEYSLVSAIRGRDAIESTKNLHVGSVEEIETAVIATYMNLVSQRMILWISSFETTEYSKDMIERMVDAMIRQPEFGFNPINQTVNGVEMFIVDRQNSIDIFWREDEIMIYFSINNVSVEDSLYIVNSFINKE
jgi:hypothetical protein